MIGFTIALSRVTLNTWILDRKTNVIPNEVCENKEKIIGLRKEIRRLKNNNFPPFVVSRSLVFNRLRGYFYGGVVWKLNLSSTIVLAKTYIYFVDKNILESFLKYQFYLLLEVFKFQM